MSATEYAHGAPLHPWDRVEPRARTLLISFCGVFDAGDVIRLCNLDFNQLPSDIQQAVNGQLANILLAMSDCADVIAAIQDYENEMYDYAKGITH